MRLNLVYSDAWSSAPHSTLVPLLAQRQGDSMGVTTPPDVEIELIAGDLEAYRPLIEWLADTAFIASRAKLPLAA